jgi:amidase
VAIVFGEGADVLPIARDVRALLDGFAARLSGAGAAVEEARLPVPLADGLATWRALTSPIIGASLPDRVFDRFAALENAPGDDPLPTAARAMVSRFRDVQIATDRRQHQRVAWAEFFGDYDILLAPVMPVAAYPHDTDRPIAERMLDVDGVAVPYHLAAAWVCAIGVMLLPVVTLPVGLTEAGLPAGVQVVGPFLSDLWLLRVAQLLDFAAGPGFSAPPVG